MEKLKTLFSRHKYLIFLILLAAVTHRQWLTFQIFTYGDTWYIPPTTLQGFVATFEHSAWLSNRDLGAPNVEPYFYLFYFLRGLFANFGLMYEVSVAFIYYFPIIFLAPVGMYMLARQLFREKHLAVIASLIYTYNSYFLTIQTEHLTIALAYALLPLSLLAFKKLCEVSGPRDTIRNTIVFGLVISLQMALEPRILYVTFPIFAVLLYGYLRAWKQKLLSLFGLVVVVPLLSFYWLPTFLSGSSGQVAGAIGRPLFGNEFKSLATSLTLMHPSWTGSAPVPFTLQPIPFYFWILPLAIIVGIILSYRRIRKLTIGFLLVGLLGIFLTKQAAAPLPTAYQWLFEHFPGFSLFRESSKFFFLTAISYSILGALAYKSISAFAAEKLPKQGQLIGALLGLTMVGAVLLNTRPFLDNTIRTQFAARTVPSDYKILDNFLNNQNEYFRTAWLPAVSRWGTNSLEHPALDFVGLLSGEAERKMLNSGFTNNVPIYQKATEAIPSIGDDFANVSTVKYFIVPLRDRANDDDIFRSYGDNRQYFLDSLNKVKWLNRVNIGTEEVAVYENKNYKPYVYSFPRLFNIPSLEGLDRYKQFASSAMDSSFNFTIQAGAGDMLRDLYANLAEDGRTNNQLSTSEDSQKLFTDVNSTSLSYVIRNNQLVFNATKLSGLQIGGSPLGQQMNDNSDIGPFPINKNSTYLLNTDGRTLQVDTQSVDGRSLGVIKTPPTLYEVKDENLIRNGDLSEGLWSPEVEDCNNYDENASIGQRLVQDEENGDTAIELTAGRHIACTGPSPVTVRPGEELEVQFDYRVMKGREASYEIIYDDSIKTVERYRLPVNDSGWHTVRRMAAVPATASTIKIRLKASPIEQTTVPGVVNYAKVGFRRAQKISILPISSVANFGVVTPPKGVIGLRKEYQENNGSNLIANPSLEAGLWREKVGDCNAYDDKPSIDMSLNQKASSDGNKSLELSSKTHSACTGPEVINVKEGHEYSLQFDFQSPNSKTAAYSLNFNDAEHTVLSDPALPIKNSSWQSISKQFVVPYGATSVTLTVYANSEPKPSNKNVVNRYDNFKLIEIPNIQGQYYSLVERQGLLGTPASIDFESINPSYKKIHVKGAKDQFYLAMSESYDPKWRLEIDNKHANPGYGPFAAVDAVSAEHHFKLNDKVNGWYIDVDKLCKQQNLCEQNADGSYNIELVAEFTPQRWFYLGLIISGTTFAGLVGYLVWARVRSRKKVAETPSS